MKEIQLGNLVKDAVSGFTGIACSRIELMNGNVQFSVQPQLTPDSKPGEYPDAMSIDFHSLEFVDERLAKTVTTPGPVTVQLGDKVRDIVTGIEGIAINRVTFINGCIYYNVQLPVEKDKHTGLTTVADPVFTMQSRLESVTKKAVVVPAPVVSTGGRVPGGPATRAQRPA